MKFNLIAIFYFICTLISYSAGGQGLEEIWMEVIEKNHQLKSLSADYRASLERPNQVNQLTDPLLSAGIGVLPAETRLGAQRLKLGVTQMFPWFGTLKAKEELAVTLSKSKNEDLAALSLNLRYRLEQAYFKLCEIEFEQEILNENINLYDALERLSLTKVESGKAALSDVLRIQMKSNELKQRIKILENSKSFPIADINYLRVLPTNTGISIDKEVDIALISQDREALKQKIAVNHPMIRKIEALKEVSDKRIALNELDKRPSFGVGLDYFLVTGRSDADPSGNGRDILMPMASVKVPIFKKKYDAKEREERLKIEALEHKKLDLVDQYLNRLEKAIANYTEALLDKEYYESQIATIQSINELLLSEYSANGGKFDELLQVNNQILQYELKIKQAIIKTQLSKSIIDSITRF